MKTNEQLNQYGGTPGILTFDHNYYLIPEDGGTRVIQKEEYNGIGVLFWDSGWVEGAYRNVNHALKDKVVSIQENRTTP